MNLATERVRSPLPRATSERRTEGDACSLSAWPTATASLGDRGRNGFRGANAEGGPNPTEAVATWPTATASDAKGSRRATARSESWASHDGETLLDAMCPTPTASRYGSTNNGERAPGEAFATAGKPSLDTTYQGLNPQWVACLMGFDPEWAEPSLR